MNEKGITQAAKLLIHARRDFGADSPEFKQALVNLERDVTRFETQPKPVTLEVHDSVIGTNSKIVR